MVQDAFDLQSDINDLIMWCNSNSLSINTNKCKFMHSYTSLRIQLTFNIIYPISK